MNLMMKNIDGLKRDPVFFLFLFILFYFIFAWRGVCVRSLTWVPSVNYRCFTNVWRGKVSKLLPVA